MKRKSSLPLLVAFGGVLLLGAFWHLRPSPESPPQSSSPSGARFNYPDLHETFPGRYATNVYRLSEIEIDGALEVAGLIVADEPRAYLLEGMAPADHHIVHDSVGERSFSVTYCPRLTTARCLVIPKAQQDELRVAGWFEDSMQLEFQTNRFSIEAETLPVPELEITILSLDAWRQRHPDSKIYLGTFSPVLKSASPPEA